MKGGIQLAAVRKRFQPPELRVIPEDDPSLLFVNAGMNQFKKYYLGEAIPYVHFRGITK